MRVVYFILEVLIVRPENVSLSQQETIDLLSVSIIAMFSVTVSLYSVAVSIHTQFSYFTPTNYLSNYLPLRLTSKRNNFFIKVCISTCIRLYNECIYMYMHRP